MKTIMDDSRLCNLTEIKAFLEGSQKLVLRLETIEEAYKFIDKTIDRCKYSGLPRCDKRLVLAYLKKLTGYKKAQLMRLVKRASLGELKRTTYHRHNPNHIYLPLDVKLLEKTDELHKRLSAIATKEILRREYEIFGHPEYQKISGVSVSHINNLRSHPIYQTYWINHTKARLVGIGKTQPPVHNQRPGSIRVDTVHQRDVYYLNSVDEITQWEIVVCVPQISERFLKPALELLLSGFPFMVFNFHSDRGGEFINHVVAKLLNKLLINQTKSRSRHCNDNALVETKNGSIIRKNMGYSHINQELAETINRYCITFLNPYLNYHRPCLYVVDTIITHQGKERKVYGGAMPPYEKLKEISQHQTKILKSQMTFKQLDEIAYQYSDNEFATILRNQETKLFTLIEKHRNN